MNLPICINISGISDEKTETNKKEVIKMDLTIKILIAMCVQAIIGIFITFYINVTIGLVIMWFAATVNSMILMFAIYRVVKEKISKEKGGKKC